MAKRTKTSWERKIVLITTPDVESSLRSLEQAGECHIIRPLKLLDGYLCEFPEKRDEPAILQRHPALVNLMDDPKITLIHPKSVRSSRGNIKTKENWGIKTIQANEVWKISKGTGIKVAVLDTGISLNHTYLKNNIKGGINIINNKKDPNDDNGHGTHVSGIIGAQQNKSGFSGVAPEADLYAIKVFDSKGEANLSDIVEGIQWCIENDIQLVNMSFGLAKDNALLLSAVQKATAAGLVIVTAAGNEGEQASAQDNVLYPAQYPDTIAVSAMDHNGDFAAFSSSGPQVDFIAPGVDILSTTPGSKLAAMSGTSFAAPHLTGLLALLLGYGNTSFAKYPVKATALRKVLKDTAQLKPNLTREQQGFGMINAVKAFSYLTRMH